MLALKLIRVQNTFLYFINYFQVYDTFLSGINGKSICESRKLLEYSTYISRVYSLSLFPS